VPKSEEDKSLSRLLLELLWQLLVLLVPIFLVTCLPPLLALATGTICAALMWVCARLGWQRAGRGCARLMTAAALGLGFSLMRTLPDVWNVVAAVLAIFSGLACTATLERRLGLAKAENPATGQTPYPNQGSAWGGNEPRVTPEGEPIRVFNHSEIAMGGPTFCDYLFSDGVLLQGVGSSACFSDDGRYFAAPIPSRQAWSLLILDRQLHRVYHCDTEAFWELDEFSELGLNGRVSPLVDNRAQHAPLQDLLNSARAVDLVPVADLWLEPGQWQEDIANAHIDYPGPTDQLRVEGHFALPVSLRELPQPTDALRYPEYHLSVAGVPSEMVIHGTAPLIWNPNGQAFACHARRADQDSGGYWHFHAEQGWQLLPEPWIAQDNEPSLTWGEPLELDDGHLWIEARFDYPQPDRGTFGYGLQSIHSDTETQTGHDRRGRLQASDVTCTRMRLAVALQGSGERGTTGVESLLLVENQRARLDWQCDNSEGVGGYRCRLGDWQLPGLWLLDHRVSDCAGYLALIPFSEPPAVAGHAVVVDVRARSLMPSPSLLVARILDFRGPRLSLAAVFGRMDQERHHSALQRFEQKAPDAANAADFCRYQQGSRLYYQTVCLDVDQGALRQVPDWRLVDRPQAATADGDFIQPAPNLRDAAWLFGSETEYADSWLRPSSARMGGYLLTASGCALADLAPSMLWSPTGRFLAVTRLHANIRDAYDTPRNEWQLLLLDVQERSVRSWPQWLGDRAEFVAFDLDRIRIKVFGMDWEPHNQPDPASPHAIMLSELLALPAEPLIERHGLWLPTAQMENAALWLALDKTPLDQWAEALKP